MEDPVSNITKQFRWQPEVINAEKLLRAKRIVVAGMGGSHLSADLLRAAYPRLPLYVWNDYGLPTELGVLDGALCIASSYSGNTEETISFAKEARERGLPLTVIAAGGELIKLAEKESLPYVYMPHTLVQPRDALGYSLLALSAIIESALGMRNLTRDISSLDSVLQKTVSIKDIQAKAEALAKSLQGKTPTIYASHENAALAYIWKIIFNETGKVPAFCDVLPEMDHNELAGFDTSKLGQNFHAIFLADPHDSERIKRRMELTAALLAERGVGVSEVPLIATENIPLSESAESLLRGVSDSNQNTAASMQSGIARLTRSFASIMVASGTAHIVAKATGADPNKVAIIENLKKNL